VLAVAPVPRGAMALVDTLRGDDGLIGEDVTVRCTVARRP
jgi:hypothetical protein